MNNENLSAQDKQRQAEELKNQARADVRELTEEAKHSAQELKAKAEQEARSKAELGRDQAAGQMESLAHAARVAADDLRENQHDALSQYVGGMAASVGELAESLKHKSVDELIRDVEGIARRNPALFVAGSIAIGLGIARFAKASSDRSNTSAQADIYRGLESERGRESEPSYRGDYPSSFTREADYASTRGYTDSGVRQQQAGQFSYDSDIDQNRGFGASSRDSSQDDTLATENVDLLGADDDNPAMLVESDLGGADAPGEAYVVKDREDKSSDQSKNI